MPEVTRPPVSECALVEQIRQGLLWYGFLVLRVGQWRADRAGTDAGTPDLLVRHPGWSRFLWVGAEIKTEKGKLSQQQRILAQGGHTCVWRSLEDALATLRGVESSEL